MKKIFSILFAAFFVIILSASSVISASWDDKIRKASETRRGVVQLSTDAETVAGTETGKAVTPANLAAKLLNFKFTKGTDVASANNMTLGDGNEFDITGVTTINTIATKGVGSIVILEFDGILILTHSNDLFLPTAANITTAAGDIASFYEYATGDWRCMTYQRASGGILATAIDGIPIGATTPSTGVFTTLSVTQNFKPTQGTDVASANAMTLGSGNIFDITGTTTINTIATKGVGTIVILEFDGILQLTHSADLVLPGATNITTAAGSIVALYEYATGDWRCWNYVPVASGGGVGDVTGITAGDGIRVDNGTTDTPDVHIDFDENTTNLESTGIATADVILYMDSNNSDDMARGLVSDLPFEPADAAIVKSDEAETLSANWVNTAHPWAVNEGGTGAATFTDGGILLGATTGAVEVTALGGAGELLYGTGSNPAWLTAGTAGYHLIANGGAVPVWTAPREFSKKAFTNDATQTAFSEADMKANRYISNQGDDAETDIILTAVSYDIGFIVKVEEATAIELCPPSGEIFDLDGTNLDANDCVLSSAVVGSKFSVERSQIAAGTWQYFIDTIRGVHTDGGPED